MGLTSESLELTILMPCLNESETLEVCIRKAKGYLDRSGITGEVVIADNGSTDGSQAIAERAGARVVPVAEKGYGSALLGGIKAARGTYVIMGDADDSYDFEHLDAFVKALRDGNDLVMGNRFAGGIEPGAMPPLHRYLGNPVLSGIGRLFLKTSIRDFHCGLRGFNRESILNIGLRTTGMEFASEMVVRSILFDLKVTEVPTTLSKDGRSRPPHLRSWRDGWRHLKFLLAFSPRWVFFIPGLVAFIIGIVLTVVLSFRSIDVGGASLSIATQIYAAALAVIGYQAILFSLLVRYYARARGYLLRGNWPFERLSGKITLERGLVAGVISVVVGLIIGIVQVVAWANVGWGAQDPISTIRVSTLAMLLMTLGAQTIQSSAFYGVLQTNENID